MNAFVQESVIAPVFLNFKVDSEITVEKGRAQFVLGYEFTSVCTATIDCSMAAIEAALKIGGVA